MDRQFGRDHGHRVCPHARRAHRVIGGFRLGPDIVADCLPAGAIGAGTHFLAPEPVEGLGGKEFPADQDAFDHDFQVLRRLQIARLNDRMGQRIGRAQPQPAARGRPHRVEVELRPLAAQMLAAVIDRKAGQEEALKVRRFQPGPGRGVNTGFETVAGPGAALEQDIAGQGRKLAPGGQQFVIGDILCRAFVVKPDAQVILQVLPDARQVLDHRNAVAAQFIRRADARQHQKLGRIHRPAGQDDFPAGAHHLPRATPGNLHADGTAALEQHAGGLGLGDDGQIAAPLGCTKEGPGGGPAAIILAGALIDPDPQQVFAIVEVGRMGQAHFLSRLDEDIDQRVGFGKILHIQGAALAMGGIGTALVMFGAHEIGQDLVPRPAPAAALRPGVVIAAVAPDIDHAIDRRRPAQHLAARPEQAAAVHMFLRLGLEIPVHGFPADQHFHARRHMDEGIPVTAAGLEQGDFHRGIGRQAMGQDAAGRTGPHDHIIIHGRTLPYVFMIICHIVTMSGGNDNSRLAAAPPVPSCLAGCP